MWLWVAVSATFTYAMILTRRLYVSFLKKLSICSPEGFYQFTFPAAMSDSVILHPCQYVVL